MNDLESAIGAILAAHPGPTVQRLMLDCWDFGVRLGEAEGLKYAAMYERGIRDYKAATAEMAARRVTARAAQSQGEAA